MEIGDWAFEKKDPKHENKKKTKYYNSFMISNDHISLRGEESKLPAEESRAEKRRDQRRAGG